MGQCTSKSPGMKTQLPTANNDNQKNNTEKFPIELKPAHEEESKEHFEDVLIEESHEPDIESLANKEFRNKIVSLKTKLQNEKNGSECTIGISLLFSLFLPPPGIEMRTFQF